jgi:hypothetical protein
MQNHLLVLAMLWVRRMLRGSPLKIPEIGIATNALLPIIDIPISARNVKQ